MTVVELPAKGDAKGPVAGKSGTRRGARYRQHQDQLPHRRSRSARTAAPPDGKEASALRILGFGHQASRGIRNGVDRRCRPGRARHQARRRCRRTHGEAHHHVEVYVNVAGGRPQSDRYAAAGQDRDRPGDGTRHRCRRLARRWRAGHQPGRRTSSIRRPRSSISTMRAASPRPSACSAKLLTVDVNVVSAEPAALRNLALVDRALPSRRSPTMSIAPYAAARAVLAEDEMKLGVDAHRHGRRHHRHRRLP